ncbi:(2Fe-2S)-binding protein [Burkholderia sp. Se-20378]|uniref:(2Fe-2S)-binding protein n=1 Tax=Burkholderia sp. Se-20378 TaxID=2703899 RepID=UPI00198200A3|nr:(2Fe-2S)-binding protein [Burkholderia sp. Se-20378]MBN3768076.1 (2Fe-2S)-binding protein [Burkholderia sp. Se-20378]
MVELEVNCERRRIDCDPDTPLLWVLRDHLNLTGTKFGCGIGACGACTVHVDGDAMRTCILPAAAANGRTVTTIEHLGARGLHPLQRAWIEKQVPQCGYCQSGMLMAAALLRRHPDPTDDQIAEAMTNLCRCGTYGRVRDAIRLAARSERNPSE